MDREKVRNLLAQAYFNFIQGNDQEMLTCIEDVLMIADESPEIGDNELITLNL